MWYVLYAWYVYNTLSLSLSLSLSLPFSFSLSLFPEFWILESETDNLMGWWWSMMMIDDEDDDDDDNDDDDSELVGSVSVDPIF